MSKKRLFVAIGASEIAPAAQVFMKKLKINFNEREIDVQWVPPDNWHITLVFLGDTDTQLLPVMQEDLKRLAITTAGFKLKISDFGAFPAPREARVVWMGVQRSQSLLNLQSQVETIMRKHGFHCDERDYWPHLTVGRLRNHKNVVDALSPVVRKNVGSLQVSEIVLFESTLAAPYPKYIPLERWTLEGTSVNEP